MVIQVRGTNENNNKSAHAVAALATIGALKNSRKSLILQFAIGVPIEDMLTGKMKRQTEVTGDFILDEDMGIDPILLSLNSQRIQKEQFDLWCDHALKMENMLDVASQTTRPELFESELLENEENIAALLEQAQEIYDDVYVYVNGKNEQVCEMFNKMSDVVIVCIRQGNKEKILGAPKDCLYLITNYDEDSMFSKRYIKNLYKINKIATMPYCVEFKDAYNNGTLVNFIHKNIKINENDITYNFMTRLNEVSQTYLSDSKDVEVADDPDPMELLENIYNPPAELEEYVSPDVEIIEKKSLFGKKKKKITAGPHGVDKDLEENTVGKKKTKAAPIPDDVEDDLDELPEENIEEEIIEEDYDDEVEEEVPVKKTRKERRAEAKLAKAEAKAKARVEKKIPKPEPEYDNEEEDDIEEELIEEDFDEEDEEEIAPAKKLPKKDKSGRRDRDKRSKAEVIDKDIDEQPVRKPVQKPETDSEEWVCPECGAVNKKKFCAECGTPKPKPAAKDWFCPECGEKNPAKAKFCLECGEPRP